MQFNILSKEQSVYQNYILEASAGTGKTFSIENIVVRLLIENNQDKEPLLLEKILLVTFTNESTRDLKKRVRLNIEKALGLLRKPSSVPADHFLAPFIADELKTQKAIKRLEQALFTFDQAQIFTIHSFCMRMLSENLFEGNLGIDSADRQISKKELKEIIHNVLLTEVREIAFSPAQLNIVFKNDLIALEKKLLEIILKGIPIQRTADFEDSLHYFNTRIIPIIEQQKYTSEKLIEDFEKYGSIYKDMNKKLPYFMKFASLLGKCEWKEEDLDFLSDHKNLKLEKKARPGSPALHYPGFLEFYAQTIEPFAVETYSSAAIFVRLAALCQKIVFKHIREEEKLTFDSYLQAMLDGLKNEAFLEQVRMKYDAAIIDEFQDTDITQWEIFKQAFFCHGKYLFLVGDPKQSIYAFRHADIYTYLAAKETLGQEAYATLNTNRRSQPSFVRALNFLFSQAPYSIQLPKKGGHLEYLQVDYDPAIEEKKFSDAWGSIHFSVAVVDKFSRETFDQYYYCPFMVNEIERLHLIDGVEYSRFAILVADRYQAQLIGNYLKKQAIPYAIQRTENLADSSAVPSLIELLRAMIHPSDESALKIALGGKIIGWTLQDVLKLADLLLYESVLAKFYQLRKILLQKGFICFFQQLLQTVWPLKEGTTEEQLLCQINGLDFLLELKQIAELLLEVQAEQALSPEALVQFLERLPELQDQQDARLHKRVDSSLDAVQILTIHTSKGLEFDIVFAPGVIKRTSEPNAFVTVEESGEQKIIPVIRKEDLMYATHCEEIDAEKIRQLYVAMTRAKWRLYLPVVKESKLKSIDPGRASMMELFLSRLGQGEISYQEIYERIVSWDESLLTEVLRKADCVSISVGSLEYKVVKGEKNLVSEIPLLKEPKEIEIRSEEGFIHSFSSLAQGSQTALDVPKEESEELTIHTLPLGSDTGTLLHTMLEHLDFSMVQGMSSAEELHSFVQPYIEGTMYVKWKEPIAELLFNVLRSEIVVDGERLRLCELSKDQIYREMEFLYLSEKHGYLKGVIDLIFKWGDRYYLLDWKSNWLGGKDGSYGQESLIRAMGAHDYYLQAEIYRDALEKYLRVVEPRPFSECYGGMVYYFLRGRQYLIIGSDYP